MSIEIKLKPRQHRSRGEWVGLAVESRKSGIPVRKFCIERGLSAAALYKWRSRLTKEPGLRASNPGAFSAIDAENRAFVPVKIMAIAEKPPVILSPESVSTSQLPAPGPLPHIISRFILQGQSGVRIEFPGGCMAPELRLVLEALSC
jgi:hypothetical protein